jgi:site-specific DNA-methyltransferase (cytosine-N4-specific)
VSTEQIEVEDWTFADADTEYLTHGFHPYPARMIPQVARKLIERYSSPKATVLDYFCGSGTVLVESRLRSRNCIGIDLNPLAHLIAETKLTEIEPERLKSTWGELKQKITSDITKLRFGEHDIKPLRIPEINQDFWFKKNVQKELTVIRNHLDYLKQRDETLWRFFAVCFSNTVKKASNNRPDEFKIYRLPKEKLAKHRPDTLGIFKDQTERNITRMIRYYDTVDKTTTHQVLLEDSRHCSIADGSVDLTVTSPPYGDSHTTVAYGQFSRFSALWLGLPPEKVLKVDKESLGGKSRAPVNLPSETFKQTLSAIKKNSKKRADEALWFFIDLFDCVKEAYRMIRPGGYGCYVIGNRTVRRIKVPSDVIIAELGEAIGFKHLTTYRRNIPTKRMPWVNAPENIPGQTVATIADEGIVILAR